MGRKEQIIRDMERLGVYESAFLPSIDDLVTKERERSAIRKEWKATASPGKRPSFAHPLYVEIRNADKDIDFKRNELGLTPKGLERLKKNSPRTPSDALSVAGTANKGFCDVMDRIQEATHGKK